MMQLTRISSRVTRPVTQAVRKGGCISRYRFFTRAQQRDNSMPARSRDSSLQAPASGYGLSRRPLSSDLFFPGQVGSIFRDIEQELNRLWGSEGQVLSKSAMAQVDIKESKDAYLFHMDAPGLTKQDISVRVTPDNVLVISGERKMEESSNDAGFHRVERVYGKFQRSFALPENIDTAQTKAEVQHGVLKVSVPKKEVQEQQHTDIPVSDASPTANGEGSA